MDIKGARVLVTGADGFIGSHLVEELVHSGARVLALSQYNSFNHWGWLDDLSCLSDINVVSGDVRDLGFCKKLTKDVDVIFHLAALIAIPFSYDSPGSYVDTNVTGTLNMCLAAKENGCQKFIQTSTSEVYGTAKYVPIDENHPLQAQSPYSASKIGADAVATACCNSFNLPVVIARPFNTYGPRQSARAIIPTIISQILTGVRELQLGDLTTTRDFNFVSDTCRGFISIAQSDEAIGEVVNIASNSEISIKAVLDLILELTQSDIEFAIDPARLRPEKSEVQRLFGDNSKIKSLTNFSPKYSLREGLSETIKWFAQRKNLMKYKASIYNV